MTMSGTAPKSPIPRSRSDFGYVGLSPREKRWTTDFSLLLPPFALRDTTGYSRLAETPVTLQPKPRNLTLEPGTSRTSCSKTMGRSQTMEPCSLIPDSITSKEASASHNSSKSVTRSTTLETCTSPKCTQTMQGSRSFPRSPVPEPRTHSNSIPTQGSRLFPRSPTLESTSSNFAPMTQGSKIFSKSPNLESQTNSNGAPTSQGSRVFTRSPTMEPYHLPKCSSIDHKRHSEPRTPYPSMEFHTTRYPLADCTKPDPKRHLASIRKSPTMDTRTLRYSPLLNQTIISRSPTLDPSFLNRSPRDHRHCANSRSPLGSRGIPTEVVRSQSMRSLRRGTDRSPLKIRNSESAQTDVNCPIHKPFPLAEEDEDDFRRLRNFSVTPKGLINWGDSFRSHSLTSVPAIDQLPSCSSQWDVASTKSYPMTASNSQWTCSKTPQRFKVAIMGADEVGKTSLIRQFQTSEYICAFDTSYDINKDYAITVILNKEESELEFIEYRLPDDEGDEKSERGSESPSIPYADAHVVIYSVTNRRSFLRALDLLIKVQKLFRRSAILLVGNKSDLVRVRAVTTDDGQTAAKERGSGFLETSAAINHQVDELLVSILTQIRNKWKAESRPHYSLARAKGLIKKFLKKACFQSKSSDNLQRL